MELIYALMIFFGMMTPSDYTAQTTLSFDQEAFGSTIQSNQIIIDDVLSSPDIAERIRTIDRTDD